MRKLIFISTLVLLILSSPFTRASTQLPLMLDAPQWQLLEYNNIPANRVSQHEGGILIDVQASASPLIYVFDQAQPIRSISARGTLNMLPKIPEGTEQGERGADDFPFRLGLVLEGEQTLNFAQRLIASDWIQTLFRLAPEGSGIDHIRFLNLRNPEPIGWQHRVHPDSKGLFTETIVGKAESNMEFDLQHTLDMPANVLALWISVDGDDTGSSFSLTLNSVSYN